jgi:hypothetical protein|tara:strand:+ start:670 stop:852 length:183 start_codon:yes stop_codon:yes gene_type:complete
VASVNIKNVEDIRALVSDSNNLLTKMPLDSALKRLPLPDSPSEENLYRYRFLLPADLLQR